MLYLWQARLGHVNFFKIFATSKQELILACVFFMINIRLARQEKSQEIIL